MAQRNFDETGFEEAEDRSYGALGSRMGSIPGFVETLPDPERRVAEMVVEGRRPYEIAMETGMSEAAVWTLVRSLAQGVAAPSQVPASRGYETAGLGADTDPGVTGGYGDTGFGAIGNEEPPAVTEEPEEQK